MSAWLQQLLVGVLVIAAVLFSAWRLMTVRLRLRTLALLGALPGVGRAAWLARLRERTLAQQLRACGGCSQPASHPATPGAASRNQTPGELRR
jgi:hypothetical protein